MNPRDPHQLEDDGFEIDLGFNIADYVPVIHKGWPVDRVLAAVRRRPCQQIAFYISRNIKPESLVNSNHFRQTNGLPMSLSGVHIDQVPCPHCGNPVRNSDIATALKLRRTLDDD